MIIDAGLLVQLDDARAAVAYDRMVPAKTFKEYRTWLAKQVETINYAIKGLPREKIRYHVCWGSWPGPHASDVPFGDIADLVLKVRAGAYSIEAANPRHEHEWTVWEKRKLPADAVLIPGVISHATNIVEHPELVSQRIVRLANLVGRENVIASTDCGFAQVTYFARVHPQIMWAKLEALVQGAARASKLLWPRAAKRAAAKSKAAKRPAGRTSQTPRRAVASARRHLAVDEFQRHLVGAVGTEIEMPAPGKRTNFFGERIISNSRSPSEIGTTRSSSPCITSTGAVTLAMRWSERNWSFISSRTGTYQ